MIEQNLHLKIITTRIRELITYKSCTYVLHDLLYGCKKYKLSDGKDTAIKLCLQSEPYTQERKVAIEYLYEIFGANDILKEIIPNADDSIFEDVLTILADEHVVKLREDMYVQYKKTRSTLIYI